MLDFLYIKNELFEVGLEDIDIIIGQININQYGNYIVSTSNKSFFIIFTETYKLIITLKRERYNMSKDSSDFLGDTSFIMSLYLPNQPYREFTLFCENGQNSSSGLEVYINSKYIYIDNSINEEQISGEQIKYTSIIHAGHRNDYNINEATLLELCSSITTEPIEIDILNILKEIFNIYSDDFFAFNNNTDSICKIFTDDDKNWKYILKHFIKYDENESSYIKLPDIII